MEIHVDYTVDLVFELLIEIFNLLDFFFEHSFEFRIFFTLDILYSTEVLPVTARLISLIYLLHSLQLFDKFLCR